MTLGKGNCILRKLEAEWEIIPESSEEIDVEQEHKI